jgi:outer membrane protein OmpA-like peptidoglycan-associated protein
MNMNLRKLILPATIATMAALLGACASPPKPVSYVALLESPDGSTGKIVVRGSKGEQLIDQAKAGAPLDGSQPAAPVSEEKLKQDFSAAMAARPLLPERFLLYFESGGAVLTAESATLLPKIIESVAGRPGVDVSIIGHSDTVGKADANAALALKRAQTIADLLKEKGLKAAALSVESHGESNLLIKTPDETAEPRNRRVEVSIR